MLTMILFCFEYTMNKDIISEKSGWLDY